MEKFLVVVECIIEFEGRFLLIKRPQGVHAEGLLAFPGGKVEYADGGENRNILIQAIKREVLEEVGLDLIDPIHFLTSSHFRDRHQTPLLDVIFHCKIERSPPKVKPSLREVPEHYWLTLEEALSHENSPPWLKHYISCLHPVDLNSRCASGQGKGTQESS